MRVPSGSWFRCSRRGLLLWFRRGGECSFVLPVWVGGVFVFVVIDPAFRHCVEFSCVVIARLVSFVPCADDACHGSAGVGGRVCFNGQPELVDDCLGCVFALTVLRVHVGVPCDKSSVDELRDPVPQFVLTCHFRTPRKRKVFRCFVVVFPFPRVVLVTRH